MLHRSYQSVLWNCNRGNRNFLPSRNRNRNSFRFRIPQFLIHIQHKMECSKNKISNRSHSQMRRQLFGTRKGNKSLRFHSTGFYLYFFHACTVPYTLLFAETEAQGSRDRGFFGASAEAPEALGRIPGGQANQVLLQPLRLRYAGKN
jgi:hypothetical protein